MSVFVERRGGFTQVAVTGDAEAAVARWSAKLAKMRKQVGRVSSSDADRRPRQFNGHGMPRRARLNCCVDSDIHAAIVAEAERRGVAVGALVGSVLEEFAEGLDA